MIDGIHWYVVHWDKCACNRAYIMGIILSDISLGIATGILVTA